MVSYLSIIYEKRKIVARSDKKRYLWGKLEKLRLNRRSQKFIKNWTQRRQAEKKVII